MSAFAPPLLGLLASCKDAPDDPTPRLILADWLADHDEDARAEFVRLYCPTPVPDPLRQRRRVELLRQHQDEWLAPLRQLPGEWSFQHGWIWGELSAEQLGALPEQVLARSDVSCWVMGLRLTGDSGVAWPRVLQSRLLRWFPRVALGMNAIGDRGAQALAKSPHLSGLTGLGLACNGITLAGTRTLASSPHLSQVCHLNLAWNHLGDEGAQVMVESSSLARLTSLDLRANGVSKTAARLLRQRFGAAVLV